MNQEDIKVMINNEVDKRLEIRMLLYGKDVNKTMQIVANEAVARQIETMRTTFKDTANQIFQNVEFVKEFKKDIHRYIESEIKLQLAKKGIQEVITDKITDIMSYKMSDIIKEVVTSTLGRINRKLEYDLKRTKDLTLSIDTEIKSTMHHLPVSYNTEKLITKTVMNILSGKIKDKNQLPFKDSRSEEQKFLEENVEGKENGERN